MKMLDLFSGIGGFSFAANQHGIETVGFCENDAFCAKVLKKHWPHVKNFGDITTLDFHERVDIITGGFPCQPFSVAGSKKGADDNRYLWPHFLKIIKQSQPRWVIAENVPGIINLALERVLTDLENENYETQTLLIPASAVGAPHKRERVWIVANRDSQRFDLRNDFWEKRQIKINEKRDDSKNLSDGQQFKPRSWQAFNAQNWLESANTNSEPGGETDSNPKSKPAERDARMGFTGCARKYFANTTGTYLPQFDWEKNQPPVPGVDDGVPFGLDRNRSLGNAIVPQIASVLFGAIVEIEKDFLNERKN